MTWINKNKILILKKLGAKHSSSKYLLLTNKLSARMLRPGIYLQKWDKSLKTASSTS
jgi:hypothetical protein